LLRYIAGSDFSPGDRLPSLEELSGLLGISVGKLREQLHVARTLGVVEVRPHTGIRLLAFDFLPAVRYSLLMALAIDPASFEAFTNLRNHVEAAFWDEAVAQMTAEDLARLRELVRLAFAKLNGHPIQIPHAEHRQLHMTIFGRLANPFVKGLLEAYWEGYEAVELNLYADYAYLQQVWQYHEQIVSAIADGDSDAGYTALVEHAALLRYREAHTVLRGAGAPGADGFAPPVRRHPPVLP
jgi:DNA-binding FadR family transcriptional regulator